MGLILLASSIHWDLDQLVLPASLMWSVGVLSTISIDKCAGCGNESITLGKRKQRQCSKCQMPYVKGSGTAFTRIRGRTRLALEIPTAVVFLLFGSIRLLCLPVLLLHIMVGLFAPTAKRDRLLNCTGILFLVLLFAPIDIEIGGFHGPHFGMARTGPRFVRLVKGMPRIGRCLERYGE
ncbi:MAG TPA: hypothetical protein PLO50_12655, partial [Nitrospira sp.]|nr:hypothetical protein [Nitrospira sp.]